MEKGDGRDLRYIELLQERGGNGRHKEKVRKRQGAFHAKWLGVHDTEKMSIFDGVRNL